MTEFRFNFHCSHNLYLALLFLSTRFVTYRIHISFEFCFKTFRSFFLLISYHSFKWIFERNNDHFSWHPFSRRLLVCYDDFCSYFPMDHFSSFLNHTYDVCRTGIFWIQSCSIFFVWAIQLGIQNFNFNNTIRVP